MPESITKPVLEEVWSELLDFLKSELDSNITWINDRSHSSRSHRIFNHPWDTTIILKLDGNFSLRSQNFLYYYRIEERTIPLADPDCYQKILNHIKKPDD